jgi:hypothetical protein
LVDQLLPLFLPLLQLQGLAVLQLLEPLLLSLLRLRCLFVAWQAV